MAHSITLAIATLGYASAPLPPLNAAIALSILFLGPEIVRVWRGETSFTIRHPWVVAFAFGLLHGFGFASGLTRDGPAEGGDPARAAAVQRRRRDRARSRSSCSSCCSSAPSGRSRSAGRAGSQALPGYAVGCLGAYWTIQRTLVLLGGLR